MNQCLYHWVQHCLGLCNLDDRRSIVRTCTRWIFLANVRRMSYIIVYTNVRGLYIGRWLQNIRLKVFIDL